MTRAKVAAGISAAAMVLALPMVALHEGLRTSPYRDPVGIMTVCYGETNAEMRRYTPAECRQLLRDSLASHGAAIAVCIPEALPDHVKAAALSFAYNVGASAFCGSTMARKLSQGDIAGGCAELSRWVYAKGQRLPGLVKRRADERRMCEGRS